MKILNRYILITLAFISLAIALVWAIDQKRAQLQGAWWRFRYHRLRPAWHDCQRVWGKVKAAIVRNVATITAGLLWLLGGNLAGQKK
jgi:hypothetical protein